MLVITLVSRMNALINISINEKFKTKLVDCGRCSYCLKQLGNPRKCLKRVLLAETNFGWFARQPTPVDAEALKHISDSRMDCEKVLKGFKLGAVQGSIRYSWKLKHTVAKPSADGIALAQTCIFNIFLADVLNFPTLCPLNSGLKKTSARKRKNRRDQLKKLLRTSENGILSASYQFDPNLDYNCVDYVNPAPREVFSDKWRISKNLGHYVPPVYVEGQSFAFARNPSRKCQICQNWGHFRENCYLSTKLPEILYAPVNSDDEVYSD